jgi:hypothetical protein
MGAFRSLAQRLGLPPLDFDLGEHSRGKIMRASIMPAIALAVQGTILSLGIKYERLELVGIVPDSGAPEIWQHIYRLASEIQFVEILSLASLFAAGLYRWTRSEGTWSLVIGVLLTTVGLVVASGVAIVHLVTEESVVGYFQGFSWLSLARTCGLLAIGYFFLAYRGLTSQLPPRRRRRIRRPQRPSSLAPLED